MSWSKKLLPLLLILLLALILRLPHLNDSFWLDEAAQVLESLRSLNQQLQIKDDFQPPLLHLITFLSLKVAQSEWWLRLTGALLPGLLTIIGGYFLGIKIAGKKVAISASLLLATSSFHLFFSQELRPYSLSACWAVWSWFFLLEAHQFGQDVYQIKPNSKLNWFFNLFPVNRDFFLFLFCTILGLYTSYLYPFVYLSQLIYLAYCQKAYRLSIYALFIPSIAFLPWLPSFLAQLSAGQALRESFPGWENIVSFSLLKAPALTFGKFLFGVINLEFFTLTRQKTWPFFAIQNFSAAMPFVLITTLFAALLIYCFYQQKQLAKTTDKQIWLYLLFALILPFALASLVSIFVPLIQPKRVIFLLPIVYLALSWLIFGKRANWRQLAWPQWTLFLLLLTINFYGSLSYYQQKDLQKEPWREAVGELHLKYEPAETIAVFSFPDAFAPWRYYERAYSKKFPILATGSYHLSSIEATRALLTPVLGYQRVITFDYLTSLTDEKNLIKATLLDFGFTIEHDYDYNTLGFVRIYEQSLNKKGAYESWD